MKQRTKEAWAVVEIGGQFPVEVCNISARSKKGELIPFKPWAIFTKKEDALKAAKRGTPKSFKTKVVNVTMIYTI